MKKWNKPVIVTIDEKELENIVKAGACSIFGCMAGFDSPIAKS